MSTGGPEGAEGKTLLGAPGPGGVHGRKGCEAEPPPALPLLPAEGRRQRRPTARPLSGAGRRQGAPHKTATAAPGRPVATQRVSAAFILPSSPASRPPARPLGGGGAVSGSPPVPSRPIPCRRPCSPRTPPGISPSPAAASWGCTTSGWPAACRSMPPSSSPTPGRSTVPPPGRSPPPPSSAAPAWVRGARGRLWGGFGGIGGLLGALLGRPWV